MSNIDLGRILNEPHYALDFQIMAGDLLDFLDTSEQNIEHLYHRECEEAQRRAMTAGLPDGYQAHIQANADHRFRVSLPLRVRYGALIGLTTTVEWAVKDLKRGIRDPLGKCPRGRNLTVHTLSALNARTRVGFDEAVLDYEALVRVRHFITHAAGIVASGDCGRGLNAAIERLDGFSVDSRHFLGPHVCIERGALNRYVNEIGQLVVALYRACCEQGLVDCEPLQRSS
jgi:hypothetical protein